MNQILITEKVYVTPELKKKKKIYQFAFIISIICICLLSSYYIYAEYDRNKNEQISQELLAGMDNTTFQDDDGILTVISNSISSLSPFSTKILFFLNSK